jgi:hypothetical protein
MKNIIIGIQILGVACGVALLVGVIMLGRLVVTEVKENGLKGVVEQIWEGE